MTWGNVADSLMDCPNMASGYGVTDGGPSGAGNRWGVYLSSSNAPYQKGYKGELQYPVSSSTWTAPTGETVDVPCFAVPYDGSGGATESEKLPECDSDFTILCECLYLDTAVRGLTD